jgi:hypothetical protein
MYMIICGNCGNTIFYIHSYMNTGKTGEIEFVMYCSNCGNNIKIIYDSILDIYNLKAAGIY